MTRRELLDRALAAAASRVVLGSGVASAASSGQAVSIILQEDASAPIRFGASEILRALEEKGSRVRIACTPVAGDFQIRLLRGNNASRKAHEPEPWSCPDAPESYALGPVSNRLIVVEGSDENGLMYGSLELGEQIRAAEGTDFLVQLKPSRKSPFLQIRGINMFLTTQDIDEPSGAFWSEDYWKGYFDMMARYRYNFLDIHGPCDAVTISFPNAYSYFVSPPGFPEVGVGPERASKNMAQLRYVIHLAADRGIQVGFMNYEVFPPIGPWKTRRFGVDQRWAPVPQAFLTDPAKIEIYTREAVASFLEQLPGLWMFGFRIGESGEDEEFYRKTYLEVLKTASPRLNIYTRTWLADPAKLRKLPALVKNRVLFEIKYNGEHLGLPYQAVLGGRFYPPSGSYESYTDYPRDYSIIWQIRAHGTHRIFYWGWPEFARRTVRSCKFGGGTGFSMEPMDAYNPAADYLHNNPATNHRFYHWMYEREWVWHLIWGRAAYDPDVPDRVFVNEFVRRFGSHAGPLIFEGLEAGSRIVPFIYAYHNQGLDHQDFAPELENGDHSLEARGRFWNGMRLVQAGGNNYDFLQVRALDRTAMADPASYVNGHLTNELDGKLSPDQAAAFLETAAQAGEAQIEAAAKLHPSDPKNFQCIQMDVQAAACLGRYYANRIRSVTHLEFYHRTDHHSELVSAYRYLKQARLDWERLSDITERHYGYVPDYIRMGVPKFYWRSELEGIYADLEQLNQLEAQFRHPDERKALSYFRVIVGHVPPLKIRSGKPFRATATLPVTIENAHIYIFYTSSPSQGFTKMIPLRSEDAFARTWTAEIPAADIAPGRLYYYFEVGIGPGFFIGTLVNRPPYCVLVTDNDSKPGISHRPLRGSVQGKSVVLKARVTAKAGIQSVRLYYKRMPSYFDWLAMEMKSLGNGEYGAEAPLTSEGMLYYFEAIDDDGNAAHCPEFLSQTPYFVINGWAPGGRASEAEDIGSEVS